MSQCAAAPGHTAQPFQPTDTAKGFLLDAWCRNVALKVAITFESLAKQTAKHIGTTKVADALKVAESLKEGDLAFINPPYSGVHYSRFYHVLETIALGHCGAVWGAGRYPHEELRPRSKFSVLSESRQALDELLSEVASRKAKAILTFPDHEFSNGLSGDTVCEVARNYFRVREIKVKSRFSTLGGTSDLKRKQEASRSARHHAKELMLVLRPK